MSLCNFRSFTALTALVTGLWAAPGCDADDSTTARLAAVTPDHAGMSLQLADSAAIELADGEVVDLELSDEQRASLECDGEERSSQVLLPPLELGERSFAAPVLEAACDGEAELRLSLHEAGEACEGEGCIGFAPVGGEGLLLSAAESAPAAALECDKVGKRVCVPCSPSNYMPRTVTSVSQVNGKCYYSYSYGACTPICGE